ncbi:MAG TPA: ATP-binding protein [Thermoanaerobaculia bacterium]|nr:ATP-binding protein [Thermoanaerobaculia bacterium]
MPNAPRYLSPQVRSDLAKKMVFIAGPRQVGKTTLALALRGARNGYLNWDVAEHRERILRRELPKGRLWVFDELHKYRRWRNYLKGLYDGRPAGQKILVTGSGRLDLYRFGGDSLQGRYHLLRLHPFSVAELGIRDRDGFDQLLRLGGFPEPFLGGNEVEGRRWSREYRTRLIREDVLSLERIQDLGQLELLMIRLPDLVGSPLSINALREDLQVSHKAVSSWIEALERLYAVFRLAPFGAPRIRAVRKEQKHYHFDWSLVPGEAPRFENAVASHLLKWVHFQQDAKGLDVELRYFRDVDGREVDFVVTERRRPVLLVECKWSDVPIDRGLRYLKGKFPDVEAWQISASGTKDHQSPEGIRVAPALELLGGLV